uniref:Protein kinase domain-containing protein n=1 Tax=Leptobrachium leishanense TaxID=445787 RepID=A0A8C5PG14_9ANUR
MHLISRWGNHTAQENNLKHIFSSCIQTSQCLLKITGGIEPAVSDLVNIVLPADERPKEPEVAIKPMSLQDFRCCTFLGRGAFGKVLLAEHLQTKKMFAVKAMQKAQLIKSNEVKRSLYQVASQEHHPFLVNLFATFQSKDHTCFVMEYAAGGDLWTNFMNASGKFPLPRARFYASCVVLGLEHLHQHKIIHRDLKLNNIVLDQEGFAKIADFGLSKQGIGFGDRTKSFCGTLEYMAPEIIKDKPYTRAVDWWSLGVLLYLMILGYVSLISHYVFCSLNLSLLNEERRLGASERGAEDVKQHLFFKGLNWIDLLARNVKPPFVPVIDGPEDTRNFEVSCKSEAPVLTPPEKPSLTDRQQEAFKNFDWMAERDD